MRDLAILFAHLILTLARLLRPDSHRVCSVNYFFRPKEMIVVEQSRDHRRITAAEAPAHGLNRSRDYNGARVHRALDRTQR